ncbi:MAG TPA: AAA family ATPase [Spirochaetota bacterium]|mgnify:CR=1 FL=1|nr:AAA family ATPase [Spirochaetota bacterium]HOL57846.1 AAA family ATPase [Spirochaetota bacterium]
MSQHLIQKNYSFIKKLPEWAKTFAIKYCSNTSSTFIFHGNIRDFLPQRTDEDEFKFVKIQDYFADILFGYKGRIICFDRSSGISFIENPYQSDGISTREDFIRIVGSDISKTEKTKKILTKNPVLAFENIEKYFYKKIQQNERVVLIIDFPETLIPISHGISPAEEDRFCTVTIKKWAYNPVFINKDVTIILLVENLSELNQTIVKCPNIIKIHIPIPDEETRANFLRYKLKKQQLYLDESISIETVAKVTGGLNLVNINQIISESYQEKKNISMEYLRSRKKELIESESVGMLEIIESEANLDMVSGHDFVKKSLKMAAANIKQGRLDVLPMGYLISGPVGTGKSYLATCFAGEIGIPVVRMLNFRSKYVGATESNIEKILNILKAMAPVGVMIDEADAVLGDRNQQGDSGTSNRVFAQIASFMGNTEYRGKIIWFLITCRPDLIPIDIKRQGRCEEHFSLFYPETPKDREALFYQMIKKLKIKTDVIYNDELFRKQKYNYSGADIEAILVRAKFIAASEGIDIVTEQHILEAIDNFIPPVYPYEVELQNLVSVLECTHKDMIPQKYASMPKQKIAETIRQLKAILGENN